MIHRPDMTKPDPNPHNRLTPSERYQTDPCFKTLVDTLEGLIHACEHTPSELRDAVMLAAIHYELHLTKRMHIFTKGSILPPEAFVFCPSSPSWILFHRAWSEAANKPGYDKQHWMDLEQALTAASKTLSR